MKKKLLLLCLFSIQVMVLNAQTSEQGPSSDFWVVPKNIQNAVKIDLVRPMVGKLGLEYQRYVSDMVSLEFKVGTILPNYTTQSVFGKYMDKEYIGSPSGFYVGGAFWLMSKYTKPGSLKGFSFSLEYANFNTTLLTDQYNATLMHYQQEEEEVNVAETSVAIIRTHQGLFNRHLFMEFNYGLGMKFINDHESGSSALDFSYKFYIPVTIGVGYLF